MNGVESIALWYFTIYGHVLRTIYGDAPSFKELMDKCNKCKCVDGWANEFVKSKKNNLLSEYGWTRNKKKYIAREGLLYFIRLNHPVQRFFTSVVALTDMDSI